MRRGPRLDAVRASLEARLLYVAHGLERFERVIANFTQFVCFLREGELRFHFVFISLAICLLLIVRLGRAVEFISRYNDRRFRWNEIAVVRLLERAKPLLCILLLAEYYFFAFVAIVRGAYSRPLARAREQVGGLATACPSFGSHYSFVQ